jgi:hypothetical protein
MNTVEQNIVRSFGLVKNDIIAIQNRMNQLESQLEKLHKDASNRKLEELKLKQRIKEIKFKKK